MIRLMLGVNFSPPTLLTPVCGKSEGSMRCLSATTVSSLCTLPQTTGMHLLLPGHDACWGVLPLPALCPHMQACEPCFCRPPPPSDHQVCFAFLFLAPSHHRAAAYGKLHEEAHQQSTSSSTAATSARDPGQPEPYRKSAADAEGAALHGIAVDCLPSPLPDPMQQREDSPSADPHSYGLSLIASAVPEAQSEAGALRSSGKGSAPVARRLFGVSDQAFGMDAGGSPPADPAQQKDLSVTSDMHQSCQGGAKLGGGTVSPGRAVAVVVAGNKDFGSPAGDGSGLSSDLRPTKGLTGSLMGPFSSTQGQRKLASSNGRAELPLGADSQPLLGPAGGSSSSATSFFVHGSEGNGKAAGEGCGGAERGWGVQALAGRARRWAARQDWREWRRIVGIGSVASLASGVMAGEWRDRV